MAEQTLKEFYESSDEYTRKRLAMFKIGPDSNISIGYYNYDDFTVHKHFTYKDFHKYLNWIVVAVEKNHPVFNLSFGFHEVLYIVLKKPE